MHLNHWIIAKKTHHTPPTVTINLVDQDLACHIFQITYHGIVSTVQCFLAIQDNILYLTEIDIEGPGAGYYGSTLVRMINDVGKEFCRMYKTDSVVLCGGKRTTGKYVGQFPKPRTVKAR
jgi:hypothetical protein